MTRHIDRRTRMMWILAGAAVALIGALVIGVVAQVEDWSRDFTTNSARLDDDHPDPRLKPLLSLLPVTELADRVERAAQELPRWQVLSRDQTSDGVVLRLVRTTRLWRFQDDVVVTIQRREQGTYLTAESRSRVGRGDLGQNPRNLRELLDKLRAAGA